MTKRVYLDDALCQPTALAAYRAILAGQRKARERAALQRQWRLEARRRRKAGKF